MQNATTFRHLVHHSKTGYREKVRAQVIKIKRTQTHSTIFSTESEREMVGRRGRVKHRLRKKYRKQKGKRKAKLLKIK
jgi:uncharacterized lipoprotein